MLFFDQDEKISNTKLILKYSIILPTLTHLWDEKLMLNILACLLMRTSPGNIIFYI